MKFFICFFSFVSILLANCEDKSISLEAIEQMRINFKSCDKYRAIQNALSRNHVTDIAMNWDRYATISHNFSHTISGELQVTDQQMSGRCWLFAALNVLRVPFAKEFNLGTFEFSQSYLFFWDRLEKANFFYENILETADRPLEDRLVMKILSGDMVSDGGLWNMTMNLINKYGVVPQSVYPDNATCLNSNSFNQILQMKLRRHAEVLRELVAAERSPEEIVEKKYEMLEEIYRMLSLHMGTPPIQFNWDFVDQDNTFFSFKHITPREFAQVFAQINDDDYVTLVHSPREITPYFQAYTGKYSTNLIEGERAICLNVPMDVMKEIAVTSIKEGSPFWIACDVAKFMNPDLGVLDTKLYDLELVYDTSFASTKEARMNYLDSSLTHAMVCTGVNLEDELPTRWRIENSWGAEYGNQGFFVMTDDWFSEYLFEIVVRKEYLTDEVLRILELEPICLSPWDPLVN